MTQEQFFMLLTRYKELLDYLFERLPEISKEIEKAVTHDPALVDDPATAELIDLIDARMNELESAVLS